MSLMLVCLPEGGNGPSSMVGVGDQRSKFECIAYHIQFIHNTGMVDTCMS